MPGGGARPSISWAVGLPVRSSASLAVPTPSCSAAAHRRVVAAHSSSRIASSSPARAAMGRVSELRPLTDGQARAQPCQRHKLGDGQAAVVAARRRTLVVRMQLMDVLQRPLLRLERGLQLRAQPLLHAIDVLQPGCMPTSA